MTQPYEGPFRVESRTQTGVKIHLPGRGIEEVALARVKPAYAENIDPTENFDDLEHEVPHSPPPPGRRPGPRTRQPEPTQRTTRQRSGTNTTAPEPSPFNPGEGTSSRAQSLPNPQEPDSEDEYLNRLRRPQVPVADSDNESEQSLPPKQPPAAPPQPCPTPDNPTTENSDERPILPDENPAPAPPRPQANQNSGPRFVTKQHERTFSNRGGLIPQTRPASPKRRVLSFSKPKPGDFSFRRRRPDISAIHAAICGHLNA